MPVDAACLAKVSATGVGEVRAVPDVVVFELEVVHRNEAAVVALERVREGSQRLLDVLRQSGIEDRDVQTMQFFLSSTYEAGSSPPKYEAAQHFRVKAHEVAQVGAVVEKVMEELGDDGRFFGITFDVEGRSAMSVQARAAAYRDALAKADQYAQLAGRRLELMSIVEEEGSAPVLYRTGAGTDGGTIPVAAGEVVVAARVSTEFRLY
ncbi:SIMPL domain-containing protein [Streptomyces lavendulae]|uniref:SIMPL domain-containing protein n=1 Tax=Streptomyces lavendulae TaxID=1914 RepID=UPI0025526A9F|nr:SIMPL domain-containing protein [Streptomyces lavendulae]